MRSKFTTNKKNESENLKQTNKYRKETSETKINDKHKEGKKEFHASKQIYKSQESACNEQESIPVEIKEKSMTIWENRSKITNALVNFGSEISKIINKKLKNEMKNKSFIRKKSTVYK